ncbi:polysaccharide biosynthesis protein [Candidatus Korobacter versatilis]|uniref:polysaccharide biosynthesis protein n=1 Tax=Candidatus Korobacter versatilis TaxID=658062 RepID=UPI0011D0F398|nr:nucleoside-diphosphate sugar epimerase/dehydratase [Candidatus Koribacter versatilis]
MRFEFALPNQRLLWVSVPILVFLRIAAIYRFNLDHGYWRFSGISDALNIAKAVTVSSFCFMLVLRYGFQLTAFPISIYLLEPLLSAFGLGASRVAVRSVLVKLEASQGRKRHSRVVIVGAGFAGQMLLRELLTSRASHVAVALVDDDSSKRGALVHGTRVEGAIKNLPTIAAKHRADEVLIAVPSATRDQMFRIVEACHAARVPYRTVPSLNDLVAGKVAISELREIDLEDLLGREPVHLENEPVRKSIAGRVVMVTGAAGSIGSELSSQILSFGPAMLICVDHDETALFNLEHRLAVQETSSRLLYFVDDVGDSERMRHLLLHNEVDFIFHAAAYKHVPMMERNPRKALRNNVFALRHFVEAAEESGVEAFVLISSDKAVNPTNVMGCTKRIGELILSANRNRRMRCVSVRFGNVLGSQGSVVPIFQQQLREHKPLTITHPEITRFFMTVSEAVSLVLQAFTIGTHGDILVLDMGRQISIVRMAKALIHLSGFSEEEVPIKYTGLRPGEKLYEELFYDSEVRIATERSKVLRTKGKILSWAELDRRLRTLEWKLGEANEDQLRRLMAEIVPEYSITPNEQRPLPASVPIASSVHGRHAAAGLD